MDLTLHKEDGRHTGPDWQWQQAINRHRIADNKAAHLHISEGYNTKGQHCKCKNDLHNEIMNLNWCTMKLCHSFSDICHKHKFAFTFFSFAVFLRILLVMINILLRKNTNMDLELMQWEEFVTWGWKLSNSCKTPQGMIPRQNAALCCHQNGKTGQRTVTLYHKNHHRLEIIQICAHSFTAHFDFALRRISVLHFEWPVISDGKKKCSVFNQSGIKHPKGMF